MKLNVHTSQSHLYRLRPRKPGGHREDVEGSPEKAYLYSYIDFISGTKLNRHKKSFVANWRDEQSTSYSININRLWFQDYFKRSSWLKNNIL